MVDHMALNIKDEETDRLARELAAATGESITVAARRAIEERLARVRARNRAVPAAEELEEVIARGRARTVLDDRTSDEILGYDSDGLPA
jgi:antitoxin VapB